jgi:hypothetical protein
VVVLIPAVRGRGDQSPAVPTIGPMPNVTAMASAPPMTSRVTAGVRFEPPSEGELFELGPFPVEQRFLGITLLLT